METPGICDAATPQCFETQILRASRWAPAPTVAVGLMLYATDFFGDYVDGWINRLDTSNGNAVYAFAREREVTDIQVGPDGALYVLAVVAGHQGILRFSR